MDNVYQNGLYLFVCGKFPVKIEIIRPFPGFNRLHKPLPSVASLYPLSPSFLPFSPAFPSIPAQNTPQTELLFVFW